MSKLDKILKAFVDGFYFTNRKKVKFENKNPNEKVIVADASKGIVSESNQEVERGLGWVTSQRAVILLTDKRIVSGKWNIPLDSITSSELVNFSSLFGGGQVLKLETNKGIKYQFGMQKNNQWLQQNALPISNGGKIKVKTSIFIKVLQFFVILYLLYHFYLMFQ